MGRKLILTPALILAAACGSRSGARVRPGSISVEWTGSSHGRFSAPATARWCAADTLLEVIASRGDTSVGFSLIARDSARTDVYPVNETQLFTPGRPQANVALRWLGESTLLGYDAMGGQVGVTERGVATVSGTLDVRLRPVSGSKDTLQMKGTFARLAVVPATGFCGRANKPGGG